MTPPDIRAVARPKRYPPPEFPPRKAKAFARTPPAIYPPILGFLGLAWAVRLALDRLGWDRGLAELMAGLAVALWAFAAVAYVAKLARRPGVAAQDLRVVPGRSGLAALCMGGMASAGLLAPYLPQTALVLLAAAVLGHAVLAVALVWALSRPETPARAVSPTWHLSFVGVIVAAPVALTLGLPSIAEGLFWATLPVAIAIWGANAVAHVRHGLPTAPLRPMLAIHAAPASVLAMVAGLLGRVEIAQGLLGLAAVYTLILVVFARWVTAAGPSPMWGAFTFPLAALASAMLTLGGVWHWPGVALTVVGLAVIPAILGWVLQRWPGGRLAAMTNAAEA